MNPDDTEADFQWPFAPADDLPQLITTLIVDENELIESVWWSEALGNMSLPIGGAGLTDEQLECITAWLENWLVTESQWFTDKGRACIERKCADLRRRMARAELHKQWQRQLETSEFEHQLWNRTVASIAATTRATDGG